jgi:hypothetical protein
VLECCKHLFTPSKHKRGTFHAGYTRTGVPQSEQPGLLLRGSECMVRFTREVPIPPLLHATRTHMQRTATSVPRAKTHQRQGHPTGSCLLQKVRAGRAVEVPDNLIPYAPRASSGSVHSLPLMIKEPESLKARTPTTGGADCRLAYRGGLRMPARF